MQYVIVTKGVILDALIELALQFQERVRIQ